MNLNIDYIDRYSRLLQQIQKTLAASSKGFSQKPIPQVRLIGASKTQSPATILQWAELGLVDFGENYVQEWEKKAAELNRLSTTSTKKIIWHFIGHLQSNKIKSIVGKVEWIHSIDSLALAKKISTYCGENGIRQKCLFEINLGQETNKTGFLLSEFRRDLQELARLPHIDWKGLMTIAPLEEDAEDSRPYFRDLRCLLDECNASGSFTLPMTELSMGMSHDFLVAIEEGASMLRIGTALFGPRL